MITFQGLDRNLIPGFEIQEALGAGGQALVVKAYQKSLERSVAIKIVQPEGQLGDEQRQRFLREAKLIARLEHEGIVHVMDFGTVEDMAYLVMEHVKGKPLAKVVEEHGPLPIPRVIDYAMQIADVLTFLHKENLVHRDLKPSNVMLTDRGRLKLLDFGLAKQLRKDPNLTQEGWGLGTPAYMAPEQVEDALHADIRADLYGLGATLFFLLTGRAPFVAAQGQSIFTQIFRDAPPDVRTLNPRVPQDLAGLLTRLLAKKPDARPQRPADVAGHLRRIREALSTAALEPTVPLKAVVAPAGNADTRPTRRRFLGWWIAALPVAGAVVVAVSVTIGTLTGERGPEPSPAASGEVAMTEPTVPDDLPARGVEPGGLDALAVTPPETEPSPTPPETEPGEAFAAPPPPLPPERIAYENANDFRAGDWEIQSRVPRLVEERLNGLVLGGDPFTLTWRRAVEPLNGIGLAVVLMRAPGGVRPGAQVPETAFTLQILARGPEGERAIAAVKLAPRKVSFESDMGTVEHVEREFSPPRGEPLELHLTRDGDFLRLHAGGREILATRILRPMHGRPLTVRLQGQGLVEVRHLWIEGRVR